ncbi:MAG: thiamine pyrophosphate-binding protein [Solirubrobacteraceae bacterium]
MTAGGMPSTQPEPGSPIAWGSDAVAELLRSLRVPFIALNPGSSYRGLHDSIVNRLGNERPEIVLCLHEEHAVAIAHGYAKVTGRPLAVALHANVGLMHATMALFNAFCDRVPMLVLGATGPLDAAARRPWIDWIHTSADQAALIRPYVKWDDQPGSAAAAVEAVARAMALTCTYPCAPTYVCLDAEIQEAPLERQVELPDPDRHRPIPTAAPSRADVERTTGILGEAQRPLLMLGRVGRDRRDWEARVAVAERYGAAVLTDLKVAAAFPSDHRLNPAEPGTFLTPAGERLVRDADAIVSLDWVDLGGTLRQVHGGRVPAQVASCTSDHVLHNGWSKDHFALAPVDLAIQSHPDLLVRALAELGDRGDGSSGASGWPPAREPSPATAASSPARPGGGEPIRLGDLAVALRSALAGHRTSIVRLPLGWSGSDLSVAEPLDYLGQDGGAGLGSGPGMTVGAALALRGSDRLAVGVLGDGDFLMGATALWTAVRMRLALLIVVANNRSYFNDEIHQERVAQRRSRPVENRSVGQRIADPDPDLAALARSLGLIGEGPVSDPGELAQTLSRAAAAAAAGAAVVVDVRIAGEAYATGAPAGATASAATSTHAKERRA